MKDLNSYDIPHVVKETEADWEVLGCLWSTGRSTESIRDQASTWWQHSASSSGKDTEHNSKSLTNWNQSLERIRAPCTLPQKHVRVWHSPSSRGDQNGASCLSSDGSGRGHRAPNPPHASLQQAALEDRNAPEEVELQRLVQPGGVNYAHW